MSKFEKLSITLNIFQLIVLVVGGLFAFFYLDLPKEKRENARLSIDASKIIQDIRPKIDFDCENEAKDSHTVYVYCSVKNYGSHRVIISKPEPSIVTKDEERFTTADLYKIAKVNHSNGNALPANADAYVAYYLEFIDKDEFVPGFDRFSIKTKVIATTDRVVLKVAKRLLNEFVEEDEVEQLGEHAYSVTASIDQTTIKSTKPIQPNTNASAY